jgi:hypothetical protein
MTPLRIRDAEPFDLASVCGVHERAFGQPDEARLVALLHEAGRARR